MVTSMAVLGVVDRLALERGEKRGSVYHLTVTTNELMSEFGLLPSATHHRHVKGLIEMHYHGTTAETIGRGDGSQGFTLHIRIWSK